MLILYLPGRYDESIPFPVRKKIVSYERKEDNGEWLVFEITGGRKQQVKLDECKPLIPDKNRLRTWLKLGGLFALLTAFCAGTCTTIFRAHNEGYPDPGIIVVFQFFVSLFLLIYLACILKSNIERYLYGGLTIEIGEIYFQSNNERTLFNDVSNKLKGEEDA